MWGALVCVLSADDLWDILDRLNVVFFILSRAFLALFDPLIPFFVSERLPKRDSLKVFHRHEAHASLDVMVVAYQSAAEVTESFRVSLSMTVLDISEQRMVLNQLQVVILKLSA